MVDFLKMQTQLKYQENLRYIEFLKILSLLLSSGDYSFDNYLMCL